MSSFRVRVGEIMPSASTPNSEVRFQVRRNPKAPPWSGDETGAQASASELATRAKEAFRAGNARECVSLATEALAVGADATTYALRGDCYRMLGDNARALRSYQRFCQLAPSHPRAASIRATAESLGGTCP